MAKDILTHVRYFVIFPYAASTWAVISTTSIPLHSICYKDFFWT